MHLHFTPHLGHHVLAGGRLFRHLEIVVLHPVNHPAGARPAGLHAGAAGEDDHHVLAEGLLISLDTYAEAFAGGDHHSDGDNSPGDAEHGQQRAPLVRPQRSQRVFEQVAKGHAVFRLESSLPRNRYCRMTCCFSFRPWRISVFTPLEMPSRTWIFFFPLSALRSGVSTEALRSWS